MPVVAFQSNNRFGDCAKILLDLLYSDYEDGNSNRMTIVTGTGSVSVSQRLMEMMSPLVRDIVTSLPPRASLEPVTIIFPDSDTTSLNKMMDLLLTGSTTTDTKESREGILNLAGCLKVVFNNLEMIKAGAGEIRVRNIQEMLEPNAIMNNNNTLVTEATEKGDDPAVSSAPESVTSADTPATSTPVVADTVAAPLRDHSPIPAPEEATSVPAPADLEETPRKSSKARPSVPPKPDFSREVRAVSEPMEVGVAAVASSPAPAAGVLSGGEPVSLPPQLMPGLPGATDSPMPELLSLKDRLKLFEKEIEDQHKEPEPKKDRKFSFLSQDEVNKMKEEEAKRIASMTAMSMEAFESLTSQISHDDEVLTQVKTIKLSFLTK